MEKNQLEGPIHTSSETKSFYYARAENTILYTSNERKLQLER